MKKFFEDFKAFALKGNILDMAVGVVIGGAFGKIITSLVADIITPLISLLTGKIMLTDLKWVIKEATEGQAETALLYGNFIQSVIDFLLIALSIFLVIRIMMRAQQRLEALKKKEEEIEAVEQAAAPSELDVLSEIRDLLKDQKK